MQPSVVAGITLERERGVTQGSVLGLLSQPQAAPTNTGPRHQKKDMLMSPRPLYAMHDNTIWWLQAEAASSRARVKLETFLTHTCVSRC